MSKIMAIANQKGGVGKTTTVVNLGAGLAEAGKKVLMIDLDPQASLTISMGFREPDKLDGTITDIFMKVVNDEVIPEGYAIHSVAERLDLIPSSIDLSAAEVSLVNAMSRELVLRSYMERISSNYDYILIDCMPSLGMLTVNALACAGSVLIPVQPAYLPVRGLQQLIRTIYTVKRRLNSALTIEGILFTMVDRRTLYAKEIVEEVNQAYGGTIPIFQMVIPMSVKASETSQAAKNIYDYDPQGNRLRNCWERRLQRTRLQKSALIRFFRLRIIHLRFWMMPGCRNWWRAYVSTAYSCRYWFDRMMREPMR